MVQDMHTALVHLDKNHALRASQAFTRTRHFIVPSALCQNGNYIV